MKYGFAYLSFGVVSVAVAAVALRGRASSVAVSGPQVHTAALREVDSKANEIERAAAALREGTVPLAIAESGDGLLFQQEGEAGYRLSVQDRSGNTVREIAIGARPRLTTWSPSGTYVSFAADRGGGEYQVHLWSMVDGRLMTPDAPPTQIVTQPRWSSDGKQFTHVVERKGGARDLYRVSLTADGFSSHRVTGNLTPKAGMSWAPSGKRLATVRTSSASAISLVDLDGSEKLVNVGERDEIRDLAWSHDGTTLLFTSRRAAAKFFTLSEVNLQTGRVRELAPAAEGDVTLPLYLPKDRGMVYRIYPGDQRLVFSCERDGSNCKSRGPTQGQVTPWAASPAADKLYLGQLEPRSVLEVDLASGKETTLYQRQPPADLGGRDSRIDVRSRDGLMIPVHYRPGATVAGQSAALFVQILGAFGRESPPPWDAKMDYLHAAGISVMKVYVRGKGGFGRALLEAPGGNEGRVQDVLAVLDYSAGHLGIPRSRTVLFGHSDGAVLATRVAATGVELGKLIVSSMLQVDGLARPAKQIRCVEAYQGAEDRLKPDLVPAVLESLLGPGAALAPCGSVTALPGEAHEIEKAESWAKILGSAAYFLKSAAGPKSSSPPVVGPKPSAAKCTPWPAATGVERVPAPILVLDVFDGNLKRFVGTEGLATSGQEEDQGPLFVLAPGATLKNVIIGAPAADGVHCRGACTLENVWWEDVGEDAATFRGGSPAQQSTVRCAGARHAVDKVFQHNGAGSVTIENFFVEDFGKLYRSCGNCKTQYPRRVLLRDVTATRGGSLVGLNANYADVAEFERIRVDASVSVCERFEGNAMQAEPTNSGRGPDAEHCRYQESDIRRP